MPMPPRCPYRRYPKPPPNKSSRIRIISIRSISAPSENSLAPLGLRRRRMSPRDTVKKERDRHVEHLAQLIQAAGADAVFGLLVFVKLLVGDTQGGGKIWLAYTQRSSPLSQAHSDMDIDRMRPTPPLTGGLCHQGTPSWVICLSADASASAPSTPLPLTL